MLNAPTGLGLYITHLGHLAYGRLNTRFPELNDRRVLG